ncbi:solute carrier family 15 member 4-like [Schistocerca americana]|uniref:solute carrier family 15 member 4-like n=1 Tax=Schistocerca americana TaxID=7009 RepID=UPI001F4F3574|nr:solute carrier family 15 member 4-like [Schistocerca americana]XP_049941701.1 solute carrier family 15 member 4-like [Schistocerca serialis cubense]
MTDMETESTPLLFRPQQGGPLPWDPRRSRIAGVVVLITLTLERLAFYALVANLFVFLSLGGWSPRAAMTAVLMLVGVAHFSAVGGGWLADALIGRYWALVTGLALYTLGFCLLATAAAGLLCVRDPTKPHCLYEMYAILIAIGIAAGTVRANFPSFGAEQVKYGGTDSLRKFFNWYYWCVNIGSLLGVGALSYVALDMTHGFLRAFIGTSACLALALVLFACGRPYYLVHRPAGSVLKNILCILREAIVGRCHLRTTSIQSSPVVGRRSQRNLPSPSWLDYAKIRYGGTHHDSAVEDVKRLGAILLLFVCLSPYWLVFFQIETGFQEQGVHLKIGFGENSHVFNMPTAWLSLFDQVFILALIPMMNSVIYPALDRMGLRVTLLKRIGLGMGFSFSAAVAAGVLEYFSLKRWQQGHAIQQVIHNTTYNASDISLLWQIPQYCLVGSAEVFAGVAGLEFAYSAAPRPLQGVAMGLFSATEGVNSLLGTALISALSPVWIRQDAQHFQGHLDYYFFLLAGIQGVALTAYVVWLIVRSRHSSDSGSGSSIYSPPP